MDTGLDSEAEALSAQRTEALERLPRETHVLATRQREGVRPDVKAVALSAAVGGMFVALALVVRHRYREGNRPMRRLERAWSQLTTDRGPSLLGRLVRTGLGMLASTVATEAAEMIVGHMRDEFKRTMRDAAGTAEPAKRAVASSTVAQPPLRSQNSPSHLSQGIVQP